jgi:predicted anti-sigma-YlaC factor YlaD
MADCTQIRPLLYPYLEREAGPAEAMDVASHLSDCTACKILMARKRRLARMLEEGLEDSIPVGDEFVRSVMATLPDGPPPRTPTPGRKRGLKLAAWAGVLFALCQAGASRWPLFGGVWPSLALPTIDVPAGEGTLNGLLEWVRWAAVAFDTLAAGAPFELSLSGIGLAFGATVALSLLVGAVGTSAIVALATRSLLRSSRG